MRLVARARVGARRNHDLLAALGVGEDARATCCGIQQGETGQVHAGEQVEVGGAEGMDHARPLLQELDDLTIL
jgi:hypothetical protein